MKCSNCGKEFGEGISCQYCGVDRVQGLANYSGYDKHVGSGNHNSSYKKEHISNKTTACYACGEIIPSDAEYCPYCRRKLYENCPKCGKRYSSQFKNCPKCGTNRVQYNKKLKAEEEEAKRRMENRWRIKNEANGLKEDMKAYWPLLIQIPIGTIAWFFIWGWFGVDELESTPIRKLVVFSLTAVIFYAIGKFLCYVVTDWNIEKWKREHPNDPRSKYL